MPFNIARSIERLIAARKRQQDRAELMARAVDAVVAGTDPRIRAISGYRKKLRPAVRSSILYVQRIVDSIPGPVTLAPSRYGSDARVHACFSSVEDLRTLLSRSPEVHTLFDTDHRHAYAHAFLAMKREEKTVFAPAMENGILKRDVAQTLVSFADRRVVEPAASGYLARRQLMRRAFFDLIASAMNHLAQLQQGQKLATRDSQFQRIRLQALKQKREGFEDLINGSDSHDRRISEIEQALAREPAQAPPTPELRTLEDYLDQVAEVFAQPERHLPFALTAVHLTRMNRKMEPGTEADLKRIELAEAANSRGEQLSILALRIPRNEMPPPPPPPRF